MTIRETIRQANALMVAMAWSRERQFLREVGAESLFPIFTGLVLHPPKRPVQYPPSLGELCLEELANKIRRDAKFIDLWLRGYSLLSIEELVSLYALRIECEDLRRALYHRRTA